MTLLRNACLLAATAGVAACQVYDPTLIEEGSAGVPERPLAETSSADDANEATFALYNFSLDQTGTRWQRLGLDLDGFDTSSIESDAECLAANGRPQLDGDRGIDNSFGQHVLPALVNLVSCMEDDIALNQGRGLGTILVQLSNWNGSRDDAEVEVSIVTAVDGTSRDDVGDLLWGGADGALLVEPSSDVVEAPDPAWDGEDVFFVDPVSLDADLAAPRVRVQDAYVAKGRIVMPLTAGSPLTFLTGAGSLVLAVDGFLLADLSQDGQTLEKGLFAGRTAVDDFIDSLSPLGICEESFQESIVSLVRDNLDLRVDKDGGSATDSCSATGVSYTFQGMRARIADAVAPVALPIPNPCDAPPTSGLQPAFGRCCVSTELSDDTLLPVECTAADLAPYKNSPTPIPVPASEDF
ncbi:MAG: hypothetical protein AAF997_03625 [Myxococcota bacterium]